MTTDLQRMHQDEWLAALRSGEYIQIPGRLHGYAYRECCVAGLAIDLTGTVDWGSQLGLSLTMSEHLVGLNNGGPSGQRWFGEGFGEGHLTFPELADWFKQERDAWDGDLSDWTPA